MLDDELTLLDGTEVISLAGVAKITKDRRWAYELQDLLRHEVTLDGRKYYNRADALRLVAALR